MSKQPPAQDPTLAQYAKAITSLYQSFQSTPVSDWDDLNKDLEEIRAGIETKIDAWMELDEHLDQLIQHLISSGDVDFDALSLKQEKPNSSHQVDDAGPQTTTATKPINLEPELHAIHPEHEDPIAASLRKAMGFYNLWLFEDAGTLFRQVLRYEPDNLLAALFYAAAETAQGRLQQAEPYIQQVRRSKNQKYQCAAEEIAANGAYMEKDVETAIGSLIKIVTWMPDYQDTWFNLGLCYTQLGDWTAAAGALTQALELNPEDISARELLIDVWVQLEEFDAALERADEGLRERPLHTGLLQRKGSIYKYQGKLDEAKNVYRQTLIQNPHSDSLFEDYANVLLAQGQVGEAAAVLKKGLTLSPHQESFLLQLAVVELLNDDAQQAHKILQSLPKDPKRQPLVLLCEAQVQWRRGNRLHAAILLEGLLQVQDMHVKKLASYYYSRLLWDEGRYHEATEYLASMKTN